MLFIWLEGLLYKELSYSGKDKQSFIRPKGRHKIRKKGTLEKDSSLGLKGINILYINLGRLVSKGSYNIPYTLFYNRY